MSDGRPEFFRLLDVDKETIKLLYAFRYLKTQMLRGKDDYSNGKVYNKDEEQTQIRIIPIVDPSLKNHLR